MPILDYRQASMNEMLDRDTTIDCPHRHRDAQNEGSYGPGFGGNRSSSKKGIIALGSDHLGLADY